jgi:hypothetical protein
MACRTMKFKSASERKSIVDFLKLHPNASACALSLVFIAFMLLCFVSILIIIDLAHNTGKNSAARVDWIYDEALGYKPPPGKTIPDVKKYDGKLIYDVTYSFDESSRRITPVEKPETRNKFLLFFGCSFTFGLGLQDNQTLPFYTACHLDNYMPYNYAFGGYGTQQMLPKLQSDALPDEIKEAEGVAVYVYIAWHVVRTAGFMSVYNGWGRNMPYYFIDADGKLKRDGSFTTGRPVRSFIFRLLGISRMAKYLKMDIPPKITDEHINLTFLLIKESAAVFKQKFKGSRFCVLFHPMHTGDTKKLKELLTKEGIHYFEYPGLFAEEEKTGYKNVIKGEGHPSAYANRVLGERLAQDIARLESESDGQHKEYTIP